jgi:hypothetical protein
LFQTAARVYPTANTHSGIFIGAGSGYTISGNVIGFANSAGTGTTNTIGNSLALSGFPASYAGAGTANATLYRGINAAFTLSGPVSNIQGNTIAGHAIYTSSNGQIFIGIFVNSGNVNIGTTTGNTIGATSGGGGAPASIYTATTVTGGQAVGILANTTNIVSIQNNTLGSIDASGTSATTAGGFLGIQTTGSGGVVTTSNNTVGSATLQNIRIGYMTANGVAGGPLSNAGILTSTTTATTGTIIGIANTATGAPLNITANTLRNMASSVSHTGVGVNSFFGIINQGSVPGAVNITSNNLGTATERCATYTGTTTGAIYGILSNGGGAATTQNLNNNIVQGFVLVASGQATGVSHQAANTGGAINIMNNQIGTATQDAFTYSAASAGTILGCFNSNGAATATLNMTGNDIRRIVQNVPGSSTHLYYQNQTFTGSTNISNNTITNVTANTTGDSPWYLSVMT